MAAIVEREIPDGSASAELGNVKSEMAATAR
jgi:hypothetical protein